MATLSQTGSEKADSLQANLLEANLDKREIPSLYGLRGAAALAVVVWHYLVPWNLSYLFPGPYAVTLFFELSGLLITWLLLKEMDAAGRVDKGKFYSRRALRLFPVFYVVWGLFRLAGAFPGQWAYFFYMGDYYVAVTHNYGPMTHAWSLGVEEKFYLVWPLLLGRIEGSKLIKILVGALAAEPAYRYVVSSVGHQQYTWFAFDSRLDAIVLGCLIAILVKRGWRTPGWMAHPLTPLGALVGVLVFQKVPDLVTYLLAVILISVIIRPPRVLNNRAARYLGLISYSLYLCHPYAAANIWPHLFNTRPKNMVLVVVSQLALAVALASVLHYAVERPFLKVKHRAGRT
jgi:peptidoglycan/LPS O-acetylase OafA/YrhL